MVEDIDLRWDRYYLEGAKIEEFGYIEFISKTLVKVRTDKKIERLQEGLKVQLKINGKDYRCYVKEITEKSVEFVFLNEEFQDIDFIKKHTKYLKNHQTSKKFSITEKDLDSVTISSDFVNLINLIAEVDDPKADAESLAFLIGTIPLLKNKVIETANSASEGVVEEIKDLPTAISRIGLNTLKRLVFQYFELFIITYKSPIENFENFNQMNLAKVELFKRIPPLLAFQPRKKIGLLLLLFEFVSSVVNVLIKKDERYKSLVKNTVNFYSYPLRIYERVLFGDDFISLNEIFLNRKLKIAAEVNDSYKLANLLLNPHLSLKPAPLNLSNRNLKRAYLYYLIFLGVNYLVYNDKKSGFILYNRLRRFGMSLNEAVDFLNEIVYSINKILADLKIKPLLRSPSLVSYSINCKKDFPEIGSFVDFVEEFKKVGSEKKKRLVVRTQDTEFLGYLMNYILNDVEIGLSSKTFIIIPSEDIQNPDSLLLENLAGFDIVYFKNLDKLSPVVYREFYKFWKEFEGIILGDYSYYSFMDFDRQKIQLFHIIKDAKIDAPLITREKAVYDFMVSKLKDEYISLFQTKDFKNIGKIESDLYDFESVMKMLMSE
ncbi:MAG: HDOD domain-containing protein [Sulfurihydrogenibium sp.]